MNYGYPGSSTHLENHNVSEEGFWPSFTDIMMVIVMVFLLVTVAVILNNWTLISDLKTSIQAQQVASDLADNRQEQNLTLEEKLSSLEKQLATLNQQYQDEKVTLEETQQKLSNTSQELTKKESLFSSIEEQLKSLNEKYQVEKLSLISANQKLTDSDQKLIDTKQQLKERETAITSLKADIDKTLEEKQSLAQLSESQKKAIDESLKAQEVIQEKLKISKASLVNLQQTEEKNEEEIRKLKAVTQEKITAAELLQAERGELTQKLNLLQTNLEDSQKLLESEALASKELQAKLKKIQMKLSVGQKAEEEQDSLAEKLDEKEQQVVALQVSMTESTKKLKEQEETIAEFKKVQNSGNSQLRSLQGEYDTLDSKYQKLLLPARSSKGKFIVSVTYKKRGGKKVIRFKSSPNGSYKVVSSKVLGSRLKVLKKKHKKDLYIKVVIPEKSGLSYNEAWKFTTNLQKKYDYYFQ